MAAFLASVSLKSSAVRRSEFFGTPSAVSPQRPPQDKSVQFTVSSEWSKVCSDTELAEGERKAVTLNGKPILVAKVKGKLYGVSSVCPHLNLPLKRGPIDADEASIICNFHRSKFDLESGKVLCWSESVFGIPGTQVLGNLIGSVKKETPLATYPVKLENGDIYVDA
mmetsp:Transcript_729/g.1304  ORF Transcript_729/g.1304 Transcript_729/m.1304 type:complete len:167 (-) Transcript_729:324-824(-)|eukprot:CAMPEP_0196659046 /NCGR_PEP_ID=MMETSP1086-20130531/32826_1 /TAXON_ID=77921 /ORGANISM="Cyanoptyche  gloeocystis , Strain SAG4.97" /LENGTH=166 /DNA_ID=CAMNT_0041992873 /DNA_START=68 /DNA_END=568 /DNA_ORIENTATION=+